MAASSFFQSALVRQLSLSALAALGLTLAACSPSTIPLGGGLATPMDQPNAVLDRASALAMVNAYRATQGVAPLAADNGLDGTAQALVNQYAATGTPPKTPIGLAGMKLSAGYPTFAETFSGWRNSPQDASGLLTAAPKAGLAAAYNGTSGYGVYWVLVVGS